MANSLGAGILPIEPTKTPGAALGAMPNLGAFPMSYQPSTWTGYANNGKDWEFSSTHAPTIDIRASMAAQKQQDWIQNYVKEQMKAQVPAGTPGPASTPGAGILPIEPTTAVPKPEAASPSPAAQATPTSPAVTPTSPASATAPSPYQQFYTNSLLSTMPKELGGQVGADGGYYIPNPDIPGGWVRVDPNSGGAV